MTSFRKRIKNVSRALMISTAFVLIAGQGVAFADGNETLGPPSIPIADGSGIVAAGTGTVGTLIGGPNFFFGQNYSSTYRADITDLGLISAGANSLSVSAMNFDRVNNGAGIMVVFDDGTEAELGLLDGNDLAFANFPDPRMTTVPQTFSFAAEPVDRVADMTMFFSSVEGQDLPGDRPSVIEITVDGVVAELINVLASNDGNEWDTIAVSVNVPAGVTSVTAVALSEDRLGTGNRPASLARSAAALSIPITPETGGGGQGCTPGFWKNRGLKIDAWTGYDPGDDRRHSAVMQLPHCSTLRAPTSASSTPRLKLLPSSKERMRPATSKEQRIFSPQRASYTTTNSADLGLQLSGYPHNAG